MLNRTERRREERKNKKLYKWLMDLNRDQRILITEYCNEATKSDLLAMTQAYERVMRVKFCETFSEIDEAEAYLKTIVDLVEEEAKIIKECYNGSVKYMENLRQCKEEIIKKYEDKKVFGAKEKEIFNQLKMDYPRFTLSAIKNVIAEYKRDLKKAEPIKIDYIDTEEIAKSIFEDLESEKDENKANTEEKDNKSIEIKGIEKEISQEPKKAKEEDKKTTLVEITEVRKFRGQFGEYEKSNFGVKAGDIIFKDATMVKDSRAEVEEEIRVMREEFEKKLEEKKIKAFGKLNEVMELLIM